MLPVLNDDFVLTEYRMENGYITFRLAEDLSKIRSAALQLPGGRV